MPNNQRALVDINLVAAYFGAGEPDQAMKLVDEAKQLDPSITAQYAETGVDAVSALLFALSADDVPAAFEALDPCIERARAC